MAVAVVGLVALPTVASAADHHVDGAGGSDDTTCTLLACKTVAYAVGQAAPGDRILVESGVYHENVVLTSGKTLMAAGARPTIDGGLGNAVTVKGPGVVVAGLRLRGVSGLSVLGVGAAAEVRGNVFDDPSVSPNSKLTIIDGSAQVSGNLFQASPNPAGFDTGVGAKTAKAVDVHDNDFEGFPASIRVEVQDDGVPAVVRANTISGAHGTPTKAGWGIAVRGSATVAENLISGVPTGDPVDGIWLLDGLTPAAATTRHNRIFGMSRAGISADALLGETTVRMNGDVVTGNQIGLRLVRGNPVVTGATVYGNTFREIYVGSADTRLTLRSSLIGEQGIQGQGAPCAISHSRGPATTGGSCEAFQTSAAPKFVGPSDYRLASDSPLVDAGDPEAPAAGELDILGAPRAVRGRLADPCAGPRRDIGAYELAPVPALVPDCPAPVADPVVPGAPGGPAAPVPPSAPKAKGAISVIDDSGATISVAVDGAAAGTLAAGAVGPARAVAAGPHTLRIVPKRSKGKPLTRRIVVQPGQLGVLTVTARRGRLAVRVTMIAARARRIVSLVPGPQRLRIGTARARSLVHGRFLALPAKATRATVGGRRLTLPRTGQLIVLVRKHGRLTTIVRGG